MLRGRKIPAASTGSHPAIPSPAFSWFPSPHLRTGFSEAHWDPAMHRPAWDPSCKPPRPADTLLGVEASFLAKEYAREAGAGNITSQAKARADGGTSISPDLGFG